MSKVTCCITKEKIEKESAYVVRVGERNKYYKSEEIYLDHTVNKKEFEEKFKLYCGMKKYSTLNIKIKDRFKYFIEMGYTWKELIKALDYKKQDIIATSKKSFSATTHKNMYICKIIEEALCVANQFNSSDYTLDIDVDLYNSSLDINNNIKSNKYFIKRRFKI